jgi:hypothetical protein
MKHVVICLALVVVTVCPHASSQWIQTNGPFYSTVRCFAVMGTSVFAATSDGGISVDNGLGGWSSLNMQYMYRFNTLAVSGPSLFGGTLGGGCVMSDLAGHCQVFCNSDFSTSYGVLPLNAPWGRL